MKIKAPIYLAAAAIGVLALFMGPRFVGTEIGLAIGFVLVLFGIYGISRKVDPEGENENEHDHE